MRKSQKNLLAALLLMSMCGTVGCGGSKTSSKQSTATSSSATSSLVASSSKVSSSTAESVTSVDLLASLQDNGDGCYHVANADGVTTVSYNKAEGQEWAHVLADLSTVDGLAEMQTLKFKVKGTGSILMKIEGTAGSVEVTLVLSDVVGAYEWNLIPDAAIMAQASKLIIFGAPGNAVEGSFELSELTLTKETADNFIINSGFSNVSSSTNTYDGVSATFNFNANWVDNDKVVHQFEYVDGGATVKYNKGAYSWAFAYSEIAGQYGKFPYITLQVKGTSGEQVLFKVEPKDNPAKEIFVTFTGELQTVTLDLSEYSEEVRQSIGRVLMFAAPGVTETSGEFRIEKAYYTMDYEGERPVVRETNIYNGTDQSFGCNNYWYDNGDGCYEVVEGSSPVQVNYTNVGEWSTLKTQVSGKLGNFSRLDFGVKVEEGKEILVKVAGKEARLTGTGEYDGSGTIDLSDLTVSERNNISEVLIFIEPGVAGGSGSFEIHWMSFNGFLSQEAEVNNFTGAGRFFDVNRNWADNGDGCYAFASNSGTEVTYNKPAGKEWAHMISNVNGEFGVFEAISYTMTIPEGASVLLKVEGNGAKEVTIEGTGSQVSGVFDLSELTVEQRNGIKKVIIFALPGATGEGTFTVNSLQFSHRASASVEETGAVNHETASWFDMGDNVYTLTREEGGVRVAYSDAKGEWACAGLRIDAPSGYNTVEVTVKGVADETVLVKMENDSNSGINKETGIVTLNGESQTYTLDISNIMASNPDTLLLVLFGNPGARGAASSFVVENITFKA